MILAGPYAEVWEAIVLNGAAGTALIAGDLSGRGVLTETQG